MSIARGRNNQDMSIAKNLFQNTAVDFRFLCNALYLRRYNELTRQYSDIIEVFQLTRKPQPHLFS